jgi:hypothetical protein
MRDTTSDGQYSCLTSFGTRNKVAASIKTTLVDRKNYSLVSLRRFYQGPTVETGRASLVPGYRMIVTLSNKSLRREDCIFRDILWVPTVTVHPAQDIFHLVMSGFEMSCPLGT